MREVPGSPQGEERTIVIPVGTDKIRAVIRTPDLREKRKLFAKARRSEAVQIEGEDIQAWLHAALDGFLVRIEGYSRQTSGGPVPIATLAELLQYGETSVAEMIGAEILAEGSLSELEKKASDSSSATSSVETPASAGTAPAAESNNSAVLGGVMVQPRSRPSSSERSEAL